MAKKRARKRLFKVVDPADVPRPEPQLLYDALDWQAVALAIYEGKAVAIDTGQLPCGAREQWAINVCQRLGSENVGLVEDFEAGVLYVTPRRLADGFDCGDCAGFRCGRLSFANSPSAAPRAPRTSKGELDLIPSQHCTIDRSGSEPPSSSDFPRNQENDLRSRVLGFRWCAGIVGAEDVESQYRPRPSDLVQGIRGDHP